MASPNRDGRPVGTATTDCRHAVGDLVTRAQHRCHIRRAAFAAGETLLRVAKATGGARLNQRLTAPTRACDRDSRTRGDHPIRGTPDLACRALPAAPAKW